MIESSGNAGARTTKLKHRDRLARLRLFPAGRQGRAFSHDCSIIDGAAGKAVAEADTGDEKGNEMAINKIVFVSTVELEGMLNAEAQANTVCYLVFVPPITGKPQLVRSDHPTPLKEIERLTLEGAQPVGFVGYKDEEGLRTYYGRALDSDNKNAVEVIREVMELTKEELAR